ncbi:MAG: hypothetical protein ACFFC7_22015, partial [Candidatus Hermodarchaeota archaeon]
AIPGAGPPWLWDHDNDGLGDGDSDGIDDWDGPVLFFRYRSAGLTAGTHTFLFNVTFDGGATWLPDNITVIASPSPYCVPSYLKWVNGQFLKFQEKSDVIHILVFDDDGRPGQPPAKVAVGQPALLGFEWTGSSLDQLQDAFIDNPLHDITLSVDGGPAFSVKDWYQDPFIAIPGVGPRWSWDHDNDGLGDGDSDGIGDWDGPILFFRYQSAGLTFGTHTFVFSITDDGGITWFSDTITVVVP